MQNLPCGHEPTEFECADGIERPIVHQAMVLDQIRTVLPAAVWCAECGWVQIADAQAIAKRHVEIQGFDR
jgi:hypothetical protein